MHDSSMERRPSSLGPIDRRRFALTAAALLPAAVVTGCHHSDSKPSREATLLHNREVREAVAQLEQGVNHLEMRLGQFNAENWQDALANTQTTATRVRADLDELKRALGYNESA
jgi:hypothetical protein